MNEEKIGVVSHYFGKINVAGIELTDGELSVGETIHIKGHTTDFVEKVKSMQIEHETVEKANVGDSIGLKLSQRVRQHDIVYKVVDS